MKNNTSITLPNPQNLSTYNLFTPEKKNPLHEIEEKKIKTL